MKLTVLQRSVLKLMKENKDCMAVSYSIGGNNYFRILSKEKSPLLNAKHRAFKKLIQLEFIVHSTVDFQKVYVLSEKGLSYKFRATKKEEEPINT